MQPHPFVTMREHMLDTKRGGFKSLSELEQWQWHADVYAFRRVMLGVSPDVRVSPPDPDGKWYRDDLVECADAWYRQKQKPRQRAKNVRGDDLQREGRDIVTRWVQSQGFVSVDDYCERHGNDEIAAHRDYLKSPEFQAATRNTRGCG